MRWVPVRRMRRCGSLGGGSGSTGAGAVGCDGAVRCGGGSRLRRGRRADATVRFAALGDPAEVPRAASDATVQFRAISKAAAQPREPLQLISLPGDATMPFRVIIQPAEDPAQLGGRREEAELRSLIHSILAELSPYDRELIELSFRHDLHGNDLAIALGLSSRRARALAARAQRRLEEALDALRIALIRQQACPGLGESLTGWDRRLTEETCDLIGWHIEQCQACAELRVRGAAAGGVSACCRWPRFHGSCGGGS